ncbi:666_t:CDS:10, partial [Acaulospora colombiana]
DLEVIKGDDGIEELIFIKGKSIRKLPDFLPDTFELIDLQLNEDNSCCKISDNQEASAKSALNLSDTTSLTWPIEQVVISSSHLVVTLKDNSQAILLPVHMSLAGKTTLAAVIICGLNKNRALDREYLGFLHVCIKFGAVLFVSREEDRKRAEILADLNRQKIMFFQNISHELRTPLTLMLSPLEESISVCPLELPILYNLQMVNRNARRLLKLVNTLFQFSRIESGRLEAQFRETDIAKFTLELASCFESMAESLKLAYIIKIPSSEEFYSSNAFKHTWTGSVSVCLYSDIKDGREMVILEITDTGIPEKDIENLFQRFYRVESSQSRSHEGTGIGLAFVKELVMRHDGEISVHSEVKKGTTFRVSLPTGLEHLPEKQVYYEDDEFKVNPIEKGLFNGRDLYLEESHQWIINDRIDNDFTNDDNVDDTMDLDCLDTSNDSELYDKKADAQHIFLPLLHDDISNARKVSYHILIVDDNTDMSLLRKEFKVDWAYDGRDALKILKKLKKLPDLILSDVMMPNMNGLELIKTLRSDPVTQLIPVIFLSAKAGEEASVEGLEQGADDYLIKPFSIRDLIVRIKANIRLSHLRQQLLLQQKQHSETRWLLFSISDKIRAGLDIEKTLSIASKGRIITFLASDPNEQNLTGRIVSYSLIKSGREKIFQKLYLKYNITEEGGEALKKLQDALLESNECVVTENSYSSVVDRYVSTIAMPIKTNSSAWGWIVVNRSPNKTWLDSEKVFIQQISIQVGLAITHAMLIEEKSKKDAQMKAAKAADEAKGQILANTSHELRTPLGAIIGMLSAFEDTPLTKDQKEMVQIMTRASDVVLSVINNILDAAKLEAQKITFANRDFDLLHVVEETLNIFGEKAGAKQLELILCYEHASLPKYVKSDPDSIKFTEAGEIVLKVSMASNESTIKDNTKISTIYVELIDTGIGIDPKFINHIWKSFSQADTTITRRQDGTGLGLSICNHLVTINGGDLGVVSELGKGSRFWFTWKVEPLSVNQLNVVSPLTARSKRVLVIDPIHVARDALVKFIESQVKRVDAFDTVEEGIASAKMWKEQHNEIYDLGFFNICKNNLDDTKKALKELKSLCGDHLYIVLMISWSTRERISGEEIIKEVKDQIIALYKPIMQKQILDCLYNNDNLNDYSVIKPSAELRVEKHENRSLIHIKYLNENDDNITTVLRNELKEENLILPLDRSSKITALKRMFSDDGENTTLDNSHAEDNPINLKVIQHQLTKLGYKSLSAINGKEAIDLVTEFANHLNNKNTSTSSSNLHSDNYENISLILMDCAMPVMSGYDASKAIRAMKSPVSQIPIIALTASAIQGSREKCLESGMNDFLTKPLKILQLKEMLNRWLEDNN